MYKRGTIHKARVLSYKMIERQLVVSTKSEIFNQKMVSLADAVPGEKVRAKIESVQPNGLFVRVYNQISGFIPLTLVSDKQFTRIEKHYSKGSFS
ncbi:unnamed protein product [Anisakis simplex]|uniref:S1 motif domain-containing protein n=1 Tax=Anisakis simplex TaxID=6269 RepID=A0A0M3JC62_ANISI|nr:unnamed protein product [Anisakis simplex]